MPIPNIPPVLPMPIANSGDVNDIPVTTPTGTGQLSFQAGFPFITQVPLLAGGIAPSRPDFNAVMKLLSQHAFFQQSGGVYPWMGADGDFAGLNYLTGWHVLGSNGHEYIAKLPSGPDVPDSGGGFVGPKDPATDDGTYWLDMMDDNDLSDYGTYTAWAVITTSSTWTAPVTGWYRVTLIGGGGAGGGASGGINRGGFGGGDTSGFGQTANGGGGGGGQCYGGSYKSLGGGAGGGYGKVTTFFIKLTANTSYPLVIGAGGVASTVDNTTPTGIGAGKNSGSAAGNGGPRSAGTAGQGGENGSIGDSDQGYNTGGTGGNGGSNGTGYGGGGGGAGCSYPQSGGSNWAGLGGQGFDGATNGQDGNTNPAAATLGGNGGNGAIIIEYQGAI